MLIREYRIPMPLSVAEYQIAQLYMVTKFSKERTTNGEGIEVVKNEPYEDEKGKGQYTHKLVHIGSSLPQWVRALIPASFCVEEKAWNAYPFVKTIYSCPFFGDRFSIVSETSYFADDGTQENANKLKAEDLAAREVDWIDIAKDEVAPAYYKKEEDPKLYKSTKTGRGPLGPDWQKTEQPRMTIYKTTWVEFRVWGLQTKTEQWLHKSMVRDVLLLGHKQAFTWMDEWFGMSIADIRKFEEETKQLLDSQLKGTSGSTPSSPSSPTPTAEQK